MSLQELKSFICGDYNIMLWLMTHGYDGYYTSCIISVFNDSSFNVQLSILVLMKPDNLLQGTSRSAYIMLIRYSDYWNSNFFVQHFSFKTY